MSDYVEIRSFLQANVENLLENLNARRQSQKIEADDLFSFGDTGSSTTSLKWVTDFESKSKLQILSEEKESLGLYVSGNPLDDYAEILAWCRQTAGRDDIHLALIDKSKKIFTRSGVMMFALQLTTPSESLEGVIFPKNAMRMSSLIVEKELFWFKGKIQLGKQNKKKENDELNELEDSMENSVEEVKDFVELPKLLIDEMNKFEDGLLPLFEGEKIDLAINRKEKLSQIDWQKVLQNPKKFAEIVLENKNSSTQNISISTNHKDIELNLKTLKLAKNLGVEKLKNIQSKLSTKQMNNAIEVKVEIETANGWKKAKGSFWIDANIARELGQYLV